MTNKEKYEEFCKSTYVPIYSKPWWMDAVCGPENWDVWLYSTDDAQVQAIEAAMPYYMERRGEYRYITKAPLTQNNGIIFKKNDKRKLVSQAELEEKVIYAACSFIENLGLDVYEQQFHISFQNWQPYFWNHYTCIPRYTYIIEDTSDLEAVQGNFSANYRKNIRKGQRFLKTRFMRNMKKYFLSREEHARFQKNCGTSSIAPAQNIKLDKCYVRKMSKEISIACSF